MTLLPPRTACAACAQTTSTAGTRRLLDPNRLGAGGWVPVPGHAGEYLCPRCAHDAREDASDAR